MATTQITAELVALRVQELRQAVGANQSSFDRRLSALFDRVCKLEDQVNVADALENSRILPAQPPSEEQIVAALRSNLNLMARVVVKAAGGLCGETRLIISQSASHTCEKSPDPAVSRAALQSLAVALAAASYRE